MVDRKTIYPSWKILPKDVCMPQRDKSKDTTHERYVNRNWSHINMDMNLKNHSYYNIVLK